MCEILATGDLPKAWVVRRDFLGCHVLTSRVRVSQHLKIVCALLRDVHLSVVCISKKDYVLETICACQR
jgi:hypothetical protein